MAKIAIVHPNLNMLGGAEAVSINTISALSPTHDVDLITLEQPDLNAINDFYGESLSLDSVITPRKSHNYVNTIRSLLTTLASGDDLGVISVAFINQFARNFEDEYDLIISTKSEMHFTTTSLQYIHYPNFFIDQIKDVSVKYKMLEDICGWLAGAQKIPENNTTYISNSYWTSKKFEEVYNISPDVIYPPVDTSEFNPTLWKNREDGFIVIGRIAPKKNILHIIEVVDELINDGFDTHLHIVGPSSDNDYHKRVRSRAEHCSKINLEGRLPRDELVELICNHKYGLHGKENEHFGMTVAEMVAGGVIPFVPNSGGQTEIVNNTSALLYDDWGDLRIKIQDVMTDRVNQRNLLKQMPKIEYKFGSQNFRNKIKKKVQKTSSR